MKKRILSLFNFLKNLNEKYEKIITSKKFKKIFQFLPRNIFMLILFIATLFIFIPQVINNDVRVYNSSVPTDALEPIIDKKVEEKINTKDVKEFHTVSIIFATYQRKNNAIYKFDLYKDEKKLYSKKFNTKDLDDNQYYNFVVGKVKIDKDSNYKISITPIKANKENCITMYKNISSDIVSFKLLGESPWYNIVIILFIIYLLVFFGVNYLINNNKIKNEKNFLIVMLIYIISILFITPAVEIPDETYHFYKSYSLSKYDFSKAPADNFYNGYINVSKNIKCLYYADAEAKDNVDDVNKLLSCFKNNDEKKYQIPANVSNTQTIAYIPSAIIIKIVNIFTNAPVVLFYIGRIVNFIISFLLILLALKVIPKYKKLLLIVVCMPMFIQQMVSYSYDSLLNSCAVLLFAYFIKMYDQKELISYKQLSIYFLLSFLILHIKLPYFFLSLLIWLIPKEKFKNGLKQKSISIIIFYIITVLLHVLTTKLVAIGNVPDDITGILSGESSKKQLDYLLSNPKNIIKVAYYTFKLKTIGYLQSLIGCFGWLKFNLHYIYVWCYYIMFGVVVLSLKNVFKDKMQKLYTLILILFISAMIFGGMYLTWTIYQLPYVEGVQGRYFIPVLLPLLLVFIPKNIKLKISDNTIYSFINIIFVAYIFTLLIIFY